MRFDMEDLIALAAIARHVQDWSLALSAADEWPGRLFVEGGVATGSEDEWGEPYFEEVHVAVYDEDSNQTFKVTLKHGTESQAEELVGCVARLLEGESND